MRAFLYFLLGFFLSVAVILRSANAECYAMFFIGQNRTLLSPEQIRSGLEFDSTTGNIQNGSYSLYPGGVSIFEMPNCQVMKWIPAPQNTWTYHFNCGSSNYKSKESIKGKHVPNFQIDFKTIQQGCETECPDSDSDGLCDACDEDPNDSTVGGDLYLKGYYQYNGETVGTLVSYSPSSTSYDTTRVNKEYSGDITEVPGYVLGLGMPSHIITRDFIDGGGQFIGLIQPEKITTVSCAPVTDIAACNSGICNFAPANASAAEKYPEVGESIKPTTEQKQENAPYLYPEKTCDEYRSLCTSSCGGTPMVQSFACSEGSSGSRHVNCKCVHDGYYELAPDWNSLGPQTESTTGEDDTGSGTVGTGTTTTGGGSATSAGGDQDIDGDGSVDGSSYEYAEGKVDYSPMGAAFGRLGGKFPFSLRHTISDLYSSFRSSGSAPSYTYSIYGRSLTISLSAWNDIAQMVRSLFALGIVLSTIIMLIYLYVGIDLRGKA